MGFGGPFYHARPTGGLRAALTIAAEIPIMGGQTASGGGAGLRVVAGRWRGRTLRAPRGLAVRPTTDRVREAIFAILGERVAGAKVLDLFAGTGAMAIEALSRGASEAVLVESSPPAAGVLKANLASVGASSAVCLSMDYRKALRRLAARGETFSLAFLDPPYGKGLLDAGGGSARAGGGPGGRRPRGGGKRRQGPEGEGARGLGAGVGAALRGHARRVLRSPSGPEAPGSEAVKED